VNAKSVKISRILHAGYVFDCAGVQIAFDPIFENPFSQNCYAFPNVAFDHDEVRSLRWSAIFISHFHDDHCSFDSLNFLDRNIPIYAYCQFPELFSWLKELGFVNVHSLKIDQSVHVQSFEIIPRRALDVDVDSMFQIKVAGLNLLNVVDSWMDPETLQELSQFSPWDMVLWPFQTLREIEVIAPSRATASDGLLPTEWTQQLQVLNPRYLVPSSCQFIHESWSWYNQALFPISYRQFEGEIAKILPRSQVVRMNPGVTVELDKSSMAESDSLSWVRPLGNQDVDYDYQSGAMYASTAEVSRNLGALSKVQSEEVFAHCRSGLIQKFKSLEISDDPYFKKKIFWRLSIFDHTGEARHFHYHIEGQSMVPVGENDGVLSWTTEVPLSKFYSALNAGESLTSMYLRVNDAVFTPDIEKEIHSVDISEDPLIRCLFTGVFGAYQLAQLKRLKDL